MCGMNLAFNRDLIGPSMYFGLMGDGQPLGRYDDMWAGWCSKVPLFSIKALANEPKREGCKAMPRGVILENMFQMHGCLKGHEVNMLVHRSYATTCCWE